MADNIADPPTHKWGDTLTSERFAEIDAELAALAAAEGGEALPIQPDAAMALLLTGGI